VIKYLESVRHVSLDHGDQCVNLHVMQNAILVVKLQEFVLLVLMDFTDLLHALHVHPIALQEQYVILIMDFAHHAHQAFGDLNVKIIVL